MNPGELAPLKLLIRGSPDDLRRSMIFELPRQRSSHDDGPALLRGPPSADQRQRPPLTGGARVHIKEHGVPLFARAGLLVQGRAVPCDPSRAPSTAASLRDL